MMYFGRNVGMKEADIRRQRLADFIRDKCDGLQSTAATLTGKSPTQISDMLAKRKSFGEKVARKMEEHAKLQPKWLDEPYPEGNTIAGVNVGNVNDSNKDTAGLSAEERAAVELAAKAAQVAIAWITLPEDERSKIKSAIEARAAWYAERRRGLHLVKTKPPPLIKQLKAPEKSKK